MARARQVETPPPPPPIRPPTKFFHPYVEDFVSPDDDPVVDPRWCPLYLLPGEDEVAWCFRMLAQDRYAQELRVFLRAHRDRAVAMTYKERFVWRGGNPFPWRDQAAFLAGVRP